MVWIKWIIGRITSEGSKSIILIDLISMRSIPKAKSKIPPVAVRSSMSSGEILWPKPMKNKVNTPWIRRTPIAENRTPFPNTADRKKELIRSIVPLIKSKCDFPFNPSSMHPINVKPPTQNNTVALMNPEPREGSVTEFPSGFPDESLSNLEVNFVKRSWRESVWPRRVPNTKERKMSMGSSIPVIISTLNATVNRPNTTSIFVWFLWEIYFLESRPIVDPAATAAALNNVPIISLSSFYGPKLHL